MSLPVSITPKVRQMYTAVDDGPSDSHQLSHRCLDRRFSCRLAGTVKRWKRIRAFTEEESRKAATSAFLRWAHSSKSRRSGFSRDSFTLVFLEALFSACLMTAMGSGLSAVWFC